MNLTIDQVIRNFDSFKLISLEVTKNLIRETRQVQGNLLAYFTKFRSDSRRCGFEFNGEYRFADPSL